jgi:hypothetical protein
MFRLLKALPLTLALAAVSFFNTSCGSSSSQVRVVDAIPDAPVNVDVAINGKNVFTAVSFESIEPASGYQKVSGGSTTVEVFQTGTTTAVIPSTSFSLNASSQYTVIATGFYSATQPPNVPTAVQFTDNNTAPTSGNVEFRIIHASPSTPTVDVYIVPPGTDITQVNPATISGLTYQQASPSYISLAAATYSVIVTYSGTKQEIIAPQDYGLTTGQIRTLVLVDKPGGGSPPSWMLLSDLN